MPSELANPVEVNTYVWCLPSSELRAQLWTFEEFVKFNAWKWVGPTNNKYFDEVDRRNAAEGIYIDARG